MFRLLLWTTIIFLSLTLLVFAARVIGKSEPPSLSATKDYQCTFQPCWRGIYPGKTRLEDAETVIRADHTFRITIYNDHQLCWVMPPDPNLKGCIDKQPEFDHIMIVNPSDPFGHDTLNFGDAILLLGEPIASRLCFEAGDIDNKPDVSIHIYFRNNVEIVSNSLKFPQGGEIIPYLPILYIGYKSSGQLPLDHLWRGFTHLNQVEVCR